MAETADRPAERGAVIPYTAYGPRDERNFESGWASGYMAAHILSHVGNKRKNNEDAVLMCAPEDATIASRKGMLFAVADGMGGASAGEFASRMALGQLTRAYFNGAVGSIPDQLKHALEVANSRIHEEAEINPALEGMGTTVSAMVVRGDWAYIAQVGDSRVYLLRDGKGLHQLTHDHSLVAEQVRSGLITEEEARHHALKNFITRAVGIKNSVKVDLFAIQLQQGDRLLVCSDGLSNMIEDGEIADHLAHPVLKQAADGLLRDALDRGGHDNITLIALSVTSPPPSANYEGGANPLELPARGIFGKLRRLFG